MTRRHQIKVFADYHQFYLWDAGVSPRAPEDYSQDDVRRMVKIAQNVVVIQPVRNTEVPVEIEVQPDDPGYDDSDWDHVVETGVELPSGKLQIHECAGGPVLDLTVKPGPYRVRALFAGLDTISDDGLDGRDRYRLVVWPGEICPLKVAKQWSSGAG